MNVLEQIKRSVAITKKDLSVYYFRGPVMIQGLLIPAFLFLSYSFKRNLPLDLLMPGLLGMTLFFSVSAITPVIAPWETRMRTFERLISSPISIWAILLGDVIASVIFGLFISFFVGLISIFALGINILNLYLITGTIIAAFCFPSLGTLISAPPADKPSDIMLIATLIKFPFMFISGIFVPISEMGNLKVLSFISPLTYYVDLVRYSVQGVSELPPLINIGALLIFTLVLFFGAVKWHNKSIDKRF